MTVKGDGAAVKTWLPHQVIEHPNKDLSAHSAKVGVCKVVKMGAVDSLLLKLLGQASLCGAILGERWSKLSGDTHLFMLVV
jgi:hypothetical protein